MTKPPPDPKDYEAEKRPFEDALRQLLTAKPKPRKKKRKPKKR